MNPTDPPMEPAVRPAKAVRDELRRDEIVAAARACVLRHGFRAASVAQIAEQASMSMGQIYRYFPNKEAICWRQRRFEPSAGIALSHMDQACGQGRCRKQLKRAGTPAGRHVAQIGISRNTQSFQSDEPPQKPGRFKGPLKRLVSSTCVVAFNSRCAPT